MATITIVDVTGTSHVLAAPVTTRSQVEAACTSSGWLQASTGEWIRTDRIITVKES